MIMGATWGSGIDGYALNFDGEDDFLEFVSSDFDLQSTVTISAWINPSTIANYPRIAGKTHSLDDDPWVIYGLSINTNHKVLLELASPNGTRGYARSISRIPTNEWTHVAGTYDGTSVKIYINGQLEDVRSFSEPLAINSEPFSIARSSYGANYYNGKIDDIRVYNRALNSTEIDDLYTLFNDDPVADAGDAYASTEGTPITFDGSRSTDPDPYGEIVNYHWEFGDGSTGAGVRPTHTYAHDGSYSISLEVTDNMDATDRDVVFVTVLDTPPLADFAGTPAVGSSPLVVTFTDISNSHDGISEWYWEFGDGGNSTNAKPMHIYAQEGVYTVLLRAKEADGDHDIETKTNYIVVTTNELPVADAGDAYASTEGTPITFDGSRSTDPDGSITAWLWQFGDGETSADESPTHSYSSEGRYTVTLTVTDNTGANDTDTTWIDIDARAMLICTLITPDNTREVTVTPIEFQALVTSDGTRIAGATVLFYVDERLVASVQSNRDGYASCQHTPSSGDHQWSANATKAEYIPGTSGSRHFTYIPPPPIIPWVNYLVIILLVIGVWTSLAYISYRRQHRLRTPM
jgi:PKD repeat protein